MLVNIPMSLSLFQYSADHSKTQPSYWSRGYLHSSQVSREVAIYSQSKNALTGFTALFISQLPG